MLQQEAPTWPAPAYESDGVTTLRVVDHTAEMDDHAARNEAMRRQALASARRVLIVDPGLIDARGHHLSFDRLLVDEAKRRGYRVGVIGNKAMTGRLKAMRYVPHFRPSPYDQLCDDSICGWLETHNIITQLLIEDLERLPVEPGDTLVFPTAMPPQIQAVAAWAATRDNPIVICNGFPVGFDREGNLAGMQAVCWRYAFRALNATAPHARIVSWFDADNVRKVAAPMPVISAPAAQIGIVRDRSEDNPIVVGFLGHQRVGKGFRMVPDLCAKLVETFGDRIKLFVHDSSGSNWDDEIGRLMALGAEVVQDQTTGDEYEAMLDRLSLLVLPYDPEFYATAMSGAAAEAIACGLPVVVPSGTVLADDVRKYGAGGAQFEGWNVDAMFRATEAAIHALPYQAGRSMDAAMKWGEMNGPGPLFDAMGL